MSFWEKFKNKAEEEASGKGKQKESPGEENKIEVSKSSGKKDEEIKVKKGKWFEPEGELAIDAYQTEDEVVIQSTIAGIKSEDLDISIENEILTIKGGRQKPEVGSRSEKDEERNYFYQECYWGPFSKEIILPEEVDPLKAEATIKQGILTVRVPKIQRKRKRKITVKE